MHVHCCFWAPPQSGWGEDGASFLGTDAASAPPTLLAHIVEATSQFLHCHWASRGWRGHRTLSAVTISVCSLILPPPCISLFPPSDAPMSESLRHVCIQQRNLSWISDIWLIVNLRGDTKRSSHSSMMRACPLVLIIFLGFINFIAFQRISLNILNFKFLNFSICW